MEAFSSQMMSMRRQATPSRRSFLESKHPHARIPDGDSFPNYSQTPDSVNVDLTEECVKKVPDSLSGSAGLGGTDSHALQHWLLKPAGNSAPLL
jgi:hypothetical protein